MADKPDFSDISKKLNIGGLVNNVKSLISPGGATPDPEEGDKVGHQLAELSLLMQELNEANEEQSRRMVEINKLFNLLFEELKAERDAVEEAAHELEEFAEGESEEEGDEEEGDEEEGEEEVEQKSQKKAPKAKKSK
ncbi:MAG: hypothetical protein P1U63_09690 [Coxiellaceae bacterium]|nr:hypothetical protein [Coxiellaceae bacterium]